MEGTEKLISNVRDLSELVNYQDGAIVSRTLINKDTGTVTLFSFDEGQSLSEHIAPYDAMVYILDGEAQIKISEEHYNLKSGQMIIMPANESHSVKATKRFKMLLIMIKS